MALGWILASAPNESAAIDNYYDGDEWQGIIGDSQFFSEPAGVTVEQMRQVEGDFQQRFTDRDVRMVRAEQTIAVVP